jgi:hypothetical protein
VVVNPLISTWCEFKPVFHEELIAKGLMENKKFLEQKVEETKNLMKDNRNQEASEAKDNRPPPGLS